MAHVWMKGDDSGPARRADQRANAIHVHNVRIKETQDSAETIVLDRLVFELDERFKNVDLAPVLDWMVQGLIVQWQRIARTLGKAQIMAQDGETIAAQTQLALREHYGLKPRVAKAKDPVVNALKAFMSGDVGALAVLTDEQKSKLKELAKAL